MSDKVPFFVRLKERCEEVDSLLCVGLDPRPSQLPSNTASAAEEWCKAIIDATAPFVAAFKPNAAFFEAWGAPGFKALQNVIKYVPDDIPVLLDVKRGDIGSTSAAYAQAAFDELGADAVTLSPYMGRDSISPFQRPGKGMFVLCKTSNPGSNDVQTLALSGSGAGTVFEAVAAAAPTWGSPGSIGLVVGATDGNALQRARLAAPPGTWILAPGVGAQGGCLYDVVRLG
ncbi:pyrF, partial [Symbiodinium sp. KB8]